MPNADYWGVVFAAPHRRTCVQPTMCAIQANMGVFGMIMSDFTGAKCPTSGFWPGIIYTFAVPIPSVFGSGPVSKPAASSAL